LEQNKPPFKWRHYGRLSKVEELNFDGTLYATTIYSFDTLDQLTQTNQSGQLRTFDYDGHGRLIARTTPEQGTTTYTYNADGTMQKMTDARGASATYTYNNRHLPVGVTYGVTAGVVLFMIMVGFLNRYLVLFMPRRGAGMVVWGASQTLVAAVEQDRRRRIRRARSAILETPSMAMRNC
jgi:YD repeat-containing protein